ncbi:hypothetical protein HCA61_13810 [Rhodococcus sp. HNM0563]|uniref:hypothetical protein n=1 Tax=Rhodococcus sp. HNM0563 TaxID=2716339 RepID=UPI001469F577|nr:hypothetical protein [Rhodococcus sp. HNM0563]NLU63337.1 hypothetical protein [Rhodococcus sp. HNM0563]
MTTVMTPTAREEMLTALHESGHCVVATIFGATIDRAVVTPDDPERAGLTEYSTRVTSQRRADILFGGVYAEAFARHGGPPTPRGLRMVMARNTHDARAIREAGDHSGAVPRLVATCWPSITGLARVLYAEREISQTDVDKALFLPADDLDARAFALANIRSGATPGTFGITPAGVRA